MPKKLIKQTQIKYLHFSDDLLKEYLDRELDNHGFRNHCQEVAENLKISVHIVESVLKDQAFQILKGLQKEALQKKRSRFRIFGFFSFETFKKSLNVKFKKLES